MAELEIEMLIDISSFAKMCPRLAKVYRRLASMKATLRLSSETEESYFCETSVRLAFFPRTNRSNCYYT